MIRRWNGAGKLAVCLVGSLLVVTSCQRSRDLPLEAGFGDASTVGSLHEVVLPATEVRQTRPEINYGLGPYLFVGQRHGMVTKSYMLFDALPESAVVTYAELRFARPYIYGQGELRVRLFPVRSPWTEKGVTWSHQPEVDYESVLGDTVWTSHDSLGLVVRVDTAAVNQWIRDPAGNLGFVLEGEAGPDLLFEVYSVDNGSLDFSPYLWLRYVEGGKLDSARTFPSADVFVAQREDLDPAVAYSVAGQDVERVLLKFDLGQIPEGATVNRAQLEWSLDPDHTDFETSTITVNLHHVREWPWTGEYVPFDSTRYVISLTLSKADRLLRVNALKQIQDFSQLIQLLLAGSVPDNGFLLKLAREDASVGRVAMVPASSDTTTGPRLIITYTVPP